MLAIAEVPAVKRTEETAMRLTGRRLRIEPGGPRAAPNGEVFDIAFVASTEELSSDHGIIYVSAWDWKQYERNPRFIANHDLWGDFIPITQLAVGTSVDVEVRTDLPEDMAMGGKGLVIYVRFAKTPFGQEMKTLYQFGDLDAVSVRWDWQTEESRNPFEEEAEVYGEGLTWVVTYAELVEVSAVLVGADPSALAMRADTDKAIQRCRNRGLELPEIEGLLRKIDEGPQGTLELEGGTVPKKRTIEPDNQAADAAREIDAVAVGDALEGLKRGVDALDMWLRTGTDLRVAIMEGFDALRAAVSGEDLVLELLDDDERSLLAGLARESDEINERVAELIKSTVEKTVAVLLPEGLPRAEPEPELELELEPATEPATEPEPEPATLKEEVEVDLGAVFPKTEDGDE